MWCSAARRELKRRAWRYDEIAVELEAAGRARVMEATGGFTVPQIIIDGVPIGGYREFIKWAGSR